MNTSGQFPDLMGPKALPGLAARLSAAASGSTKKPKPKKRPK